MKDHMLKSKQEKNKERRIKEGNQYNDGTFIYSWKSETKSWIIGDTLRSTTYANAIYNGNYYNCPGVIAFKGVFNPRENDGNNVNSGEVKEGPVDEVGRYAFNMCGYSSDTNKVVVPKEVKIIREYGFGDMNKVTNFTIEIGSQLESIESHGLNCIGYNSNDRLDSGSFSTHQKNLMLPHTLKSVSTDGIAYCNRFTRIIYCGNHNLNQNSSQLEGSNTNIQTKVYITPEYQAMNGNSIFGRAAERFDDEIDISCSGMMPLSPSPPLFNPRCSPLQLSLSPHWSLVCALLPFNINGPSLFSSLNSLSCSHPQYCFSFLTKVLI